MFPHLCSSSFSLLHHAGACTGDSRNTATPRSGKCQMPVVTGRAALAFDLQKLVVQKSCIVDRCSDEKSGVTNIPSTRDQPQQQSSMTTMNWSHTNGLDKTMSLHFVSPVQLFVTSEYKTWAISLQLVVLSHTKWTAQGSSEVTVMVTPCEPRKTPNLTLVWCKKSKQSNQKLNASTLLVQFLPSTSAQICFELLFYSNCLRSTKTPPNSNLYGWHFLMPISWFPFLALRPLGLDWACWGHLTLTQNGIKQTYNVTFFQPFHTGSLGSFIFIWRWKFFNS